jgi:putative flippase GtrA
MTDTRETLPGSEPPSTKLGQAFSIGSRSSGAGSTSEQLLRFAFAGVGLNALMYVAYLGLTRAALDPLWAMSVTYVAAVVTGYLMHRGWTFRSRVSAAHSLPRYVCVYAAGYVLNLVGLWLMARVAGWPHELAQALMIVCVAGFLFLAQKLWVFDSADRRASRWE